MKLLKRATPAVFWALVGIFVVVVSMFVIPAVRESFQGPLFFLLPLIVFSLLGGALIFLTVKEKVEGTLKKFLISTGASAAGFLVSVLLHNLLYALGVLTSHIAVLHYLFEFLHAAFFLVAVLVCPLGFLVGVVGSISQFLKQSRAKSGG